ncbi:MAG: response regulator [Polyangiaceae bacterium]
MLVVDDDASLGRGIARVLRRVAEVTVEVNSHAALQRLLRCEPFDLVLCDVMMPIMNGAEVLERLVASAPEVASKFVFMSGGMPDEIRARVVASGRACLEKPLSTEPLMELMARIQVSRM